MKHWINNNFKTLIIAAFLIPIITVAIVSISHVTKWYGISNPVSWAVYLSIGIEIAALSALAAISADMGKKVYFPFAIVTLVQFIGNIFFAYSFIDINSQSFKDWVDLVSPLVSFMGVEATDFVGHKRFLAFFAGGMLPIISLSFLHMLVKFTEEGRQKEESEVNNQKNVIEEKKNEEHNEVDSKDLIGEVSRLRLSENDLKKLEEVLLNPPPPNENLIKAANEYKEKFELTDEEILEKAEQIKLKQVFNKAEKIKTEREEIYGTDEIEEEPTALANSEYRENLDVELVEDEIVNDTPVSIETKTLNLRQVVFEPIEETTIPTKEEQKELLSEMMKLDEENGLYDMTQEELDEYWLKQQEFNEDWGGLSNEELIGDDEIISTIEPTSEEESENFSTIEPNSENIFQDSTEDYEGQFQEWEEETVPEPFATPEELETPIIETPQEVVPTPVVSNEEVEKKNP